MIADKTLWRRDKNGVRTPWVDLSDYGELGWNEIVVDGRGNIYLNNVNFNFPGGEFRPGHVGLVTPDGAVRIVAEGIAFPNGMAVTPDNKTLIIAESHANRLTAFDIAADGSLANRRVWADLDGFPDGICLDADGAVWVADARQNRVLRVRPDGTLDRTLTTGQNGAYACMLGGPDRRTLFVLTNTGSGPGMAEKTDGRIEVYRVDVPGAGLP